MGVWESGNGTWSTLVGYLGPYTGSYMYVKCKNVRSIFSLIV